MSKNPSNQLPIIFLGFSVVALCLLPFLILSSPITGPGTPWEKQLVGAVFAMICLLGILAGIAPATCSQLLHLRKKKEVHESRAPLPRSNVSVIGKQGHHPTCGHYTGHVLPLGGRTLCAGCTGLVTGALIALLGSALYFFLGVSFPGGVAIFWLGFVGVAVGLLQHPLYKVFKVQRGIVRVLVNVAFVVGAFLLLVGVVEIAGSLVLQAYLLLTIIYWIFTRIMISKLEHTKVCTTCGITKCSLA